MIERYTTPAMKRIWDRQARYDRWLAVELAICEAYARRGVIPAESWETIRSRASFTLERCDELEKETRHDLVAFVRAVEEAIGPEGRWVHYGITSYDVIDTALGMMLRDSCDVLVESLHRLSAAIGDLRARYGHFPMIGRTHGVHAEPITFGHKLASWTAELARSRERLLACRREVAVGKVSGAVGVHAHVDPEMEAEVCRALGLEPDPVSTQIVNRDRLAHLMGVLAVLAGGLERIATELRNLQRTEIAEVREAFAAGQTGSSAMPHKRNPWNSETVCGLARLVRSYAHAVFESIATWHERDLTNSSLERVALPDAFYVVDFMLNRLTEILTGLEVDADRMARNLRLLGDLPFSEHLMLALVASGLSRREAYALTQRHALAAWEGADFRASVESDPEITGRLSVEDLNRVFSLEHHLRHAPRN